jgi:hypothetical protein
MTDNPSLYSNAQRQWRNARELLSRLVFGSEQVPDDLVRELESAADALQCALKDEKSDKHQRRVMLFERARTAGQVCDKIERLLREAREAVQQAERLAEEAAAKSKEEGQRRAG